MLQFICYLMPSFISLGIHKNITKEKDNINLMIYYGIYCALNNLFTLFIAVIRHLTNPYTFDMITVSFCFKYLFVAIFFSIIMPFVGLILSIIGLAQKDIDKIYFKVSLAISLIRLLFSIILMSLGILNFVWFL